jgi:hypothetical protein
VQSLIPAEVQEYFYNDKMIYTDALSGFLQYPTKVKSLSLDKTPSFQLAITGNSIYYSMTVPFSMSVDQRICG